MPNEKTSDLKPHPIHSEIYQDKADEELINSIRKYGILELLAIKPDKTILFGHRRWDAAKQLGLEEVPCREPMTFSSESEEIETILEDNRNRRKTFSQRMREADRRIPIEKEKAKERMSLGGKGGVEEGIQNFGYLGSVDATVASKIGMNPETYRQARKIWEFEWNEKEDTLKALDEERRTIHSVFITVGMIKKQLAQPKVDIASLKADSNIYLGDCLKILPTFTDDSIDLIFADPPYGLSKEGTSGTKEGKGKWDEFESYKALHEFNIKWITECKRVLKEDGSIFISGTVHNIFSVGHILKELDMYIIRDIVWERPFTQFSKPTGALIPCHELILWARKGKKHTCILKAAERDIWKIQPKRLYGHPAEKPETLLEKIILMSSEPGDVVLDPFLGSGTTAYVAKKLNRIYKGIEKEENWYYVSLQRLNT